MRVPSIAAAVLALAGLAACTQPGLEAEPRWPEGPTTLAVGAPPANGRALAALAFATAQVGKRYCWGGRGPNCFDCSGLVQEAWASVGVRLPRTADDIASALPEVPMSEARAGDILWWPGHVGLYAGSGWTVEALDRRHGVVVRRPRTEPARALRPL